jgi:hypothetical protein
MKPDINQTQGSRTEAQRYRCQDGREACRTRTQTGRSVFSGSIIRRGEIGAPVCATGEKIISASRRNGCNRAARRGEYTVAMERT